MTFNQVYTGHYFYVLWNDQFDGSPVTAPGSRPFVALRLLVRLVSAAHERWSPAGRRRRQMKEAYVDKLRSEDDENRISAGRRM